MKVRYQVKAHTFGCTGQGNASDTKDDQDNKQGGHHEFGYAFHTLLQAEAAYEEADDYRDDHPEGHGTGLSEHTVKNAAHFIRCEAGELPAYHFNDISEHPAAYGGIEHHEEIIACNGKNGHEMPFASLWLQYVEAAGSGFLAGTAHRKFHYHDGKAEYYKKDKIDEHEGGSAVFSGNVGKTPYVSQTNGTTG